LKKDDAFFMGNKSKYNILQRLHKALEQNTEIPYPEIKDNNGIFAPAPEDLESHFALQFKALGGEFYYCKNNKELIDQLTELLDRKGLAQLHCADAKLLFLLKEGGFNKAINTQEKMTEGSVSISSCMQLVARTGSILFSSVQIEGRSYAIAPDTQIVIASTGQLVYNINEAILPHYHKFSPMPSMISLCSGASRTADIEKTLVMGAHGPKELIVFYVDL
jgi:L-lactate dehydrogenase complex protein LldG